MSLSIAFAAPISCQPFSHRSRGMCSRFTSHDNRRQRRKTCPSSVHMSVTPSPSSSTSNPPPVPKANVKRPSSPSLEQPDFVTSNRLTAALYDVFSSQGAKLSSLSSLLAPDVFWDMPVFTSRSRREANDILSQFFSFSIEPSITVYSVTYESTEEEQQNDDTCSFYFEWTLSFLYPFPWRPRVCVSGKSKVIMSTSSIAGSVKRIEDDWFVSPLSLIQQALPRLRDIFWLFPGPPPESDIGTRRILQPATRKRPYAIVLQAPRAEFSAIGHINLNEREVLYTAPSFPPDAYEGRLRRREFYSTVTPVSVRYAGGDDFEFMVNVPGGHVGSSNVLLKAPLAQGVSINIQPRRVFAILRFSGFSTRQKSEVQLQSLIEMLRQDGWWEGDVLASDVWIRTYDNFVGFNSKGLLAISLFGNSKLIPRTNEVAIDITETWENKNPLQ